jgi:hypothetical protein
VSKLEPSRALVAAENAFKQHHCCRFFLAKDLLKAFLKTRMNIVAVYL